MKSLVKFISSSLYRHYNLYFFVFTEEQETDEVLITVSTEVPMELRSLEENSYITPRTTNIPINDNRPESKGSSNVNKTESYYSDSYKTTTASYNTDSYTEETES